MAGLLAVKAPFPRILGLAEHVFREEGAVNKEDDVGVPALVVPESLPRCGNTETPNIVIPTCQQGEEDDNNSSSLDHVLLKRPQEALLSQRSTHACSSGH